MTNAPAPTSAGVGWRMSAGVKLHGLGIKWTFTQRPLYRSVCTHQQHGEPAASSTEALQGQDAFTG